MSIQQSDITVISNKSNAITMSGDTIMFSNQPLTMFNHLIDSVSICTGRPQHARTQPVRRQSLFHEFFGL